MTKPLLEVRGLSVRFTRGATTFNAIESVHFSLARHETIGVVGGSGSGKSTLARAILQLVPKCAGTIRFDGQEIGALRGRDRRAYYQQVQMVFQQPAASFDPRRTLGDGIGESLRTNGCTRREREARVADLLVQCGLAPEIARRYPHEVSGGQCQRAAIARALAIQPQLLICDEATSALDVTVQKQILELLADLRRQTGLAILFISHDLALVQEFCDRALVMHNGRIVEQGTPDAIIQQPQHPYTQALIDAAL